VRNDGQTGSGKTSRHRRPTAGHCKKASQKAQRKKMDENRLAEILAEGVTLRQVEPRIYSVLAPAEASGSYDNVFGTFYDRVACSRLYNRLVWGYSTADYHTLCRDALESSTEGWVLDAGCGSLAFTAKTYAGYSRRPVVLLDRSVKLLKMAKSRLTEKSGRIPDNMVFLHADALDLPFLADRFDTVICLNLLHVFNDDNAGKMLAELRRAMRPGGEVFLTTLVENQRLADRYLHMWANAGELVPRNVTQLLSLLATAGLRAEHRIRGNLAFVQCR
jgi:ubiquinone/menaquinone biosynthesis C-methylase UbiE